MEEFNRGAWETELALRKKWRKRNDELLGEDGELSIKFMVSEIRETSGLAVTWEQVTSKTSTKRREKRQGRPSSYGVGRGGRDNKGL